MDLRDSAEEAAFRKRVRGFLESNLPQGWGTPQYAMPRGEAERDFLRDWQQRLNRAGLLGLEWPREFGGQGASSAEVAIFAEESAAYNAPHPLNVLGLFLAGPTIMAHGTPEQKQRYLPRILSCEDVWCQGFSEPGSGSDLASLRTRAELKGDQFIINGQKVWTSFAHYSDWCMLLARTDQSAPRHRGISYILVDMKTPGVTVKPLRQMTGEADFNETFFDNVVVPRTNLLGGLNEGWRVAMTTLANERGAGGVAAGARYFAAFRAIAQLCRQTIRRGKPALEDPLVRQQLAQFYVDVRGLRCTGYRVATMLRQGTVSGAISSVIKLTWSELNQRMQSFVMELQGPTSQLIAGSPHTVENGHWQYEFLRSRANTIEAGTSEVQRRILAERLLGLPRGH
ncbi:MAG TPA: acyl-CoA dehydrogenase family protein [Candidatus Binataceae bacterium]|nr:acyl-CoA dehydrogenase family protein [Candidatus Binataceae bacterium]